MIEAAVDGKVLTGEELRVSTRHEVEFDVDFSSEHNFYNGFAENISAGGIFIATHQLLEMGARLRVKFRLPNVATVIEVEGEVRWLRVYNEHAPDTIPGMGLRFTEIDATALELIQAFVDKRDPLFFDED